MSNTAPHTVESDFYLEVPSTQETFSHDWFGLPELSNDTDYLKSPYSLSAPPEHERTIFNRHDDSLTDAQASAPNASLITENYTDMLDPIMSFFPDETGLDYLPQTDYGDESFTNYVPRENNDSDNVLDTPITHDPTRGTLDQRPNVPYSSPRSWVKGREAPRDLIEDKGTPFDTTSPQMQNRNRKGLPRRRSIYRLDRFERRVNPVFFPTDTGSADPLERWQESPPEDEPAPLSAIRDAVQSSWSEQKKDGGDSRSENQWGIPGPEIADAFRSYRQPTSRAASTTSAESAASASSRQSGNSGNSSGSHGSSGKRANNRIRKKQSRGRKEKPATDNPRLFCCTFCCDRFKSKYDWTRHEKSLHLNLESWVCAPFGGTVILPSTGRAHCAYCSQLDPTPEHLEGHNHQACDGSQRTFRRKDHLVQHLRHVHHLETIPLISDWKVEAANFTSRCGFCNHQMESWTERCDHLAAHFRNGSTMANWEGDHGFPPSIAAQITHAVPPYLIDLESRTMVPFSATNGQAKDHFSQMLSRASFQKGAEPSASPKHTRSDLPGLFNELRVEESQIHSYTQILTLHLSHYAQEQMRLGIIPTDEMFQQEARRLAYDCDDPWNQTIADHPRWLADFRQNQDINSSAGTTQALGSSNFESLLEQEPATQRSR